MLNGYQTVNGLHAEENKKASDEREAAAHVMSIPVVSIPTITEDEYIEQLKETPMKYAHVWADGYTLFDTEDEARADIERSFAQMVGDSGESLLCAIIDTAMVSVKWSRS